MSRETVYGRGGVRESETILEEYLPEDGRRNKFSERHGGCDEHFSGGGGSQDIGFRTNSSDFKKKTRCGYTSPGYKESERDLSRINGGQMQLYLAGVWPWRNGGGYDESVKTYRPYILESFYYADEDTERLLPYFGDFLLDSGAFTFMQGKGGSPNWNDYIERYADFINRNRVEKYFELDIDSVVGYDKVKDFRRQLERLTGKPSIPVWHLSRGLDEFKRMCDEYGYVAIGGIVSGEIKSAKYGAFPALISEAHKRGAKIHGLGFTALEWLKVCHFDSVDSTAWTTGNRFGYLYYFDGQTMRKKDVPKGHKLGDSRAAALNNYVEWIKFQKYADKKL